MIDAVEIARALGLPPPTDEQRAVIEAPLEPALVIAGAGSGKTETMANRVLWLLANDRVRAHEVLGLTFTRKAAGELAARLRNRIERLAAEGLAPGYDPFEPPVVSTYNSFANSIFRDRATLLGREGDGVVLSDASAWQLARSVVVRSDVAGLADLDRGIDAIATAVVELATALAEHGVHADALSDFCADFASIDQLPLGPRGAEYAAKMKPLAAVASLPMLAELVERYSAEKRRRGLLEYSDQVVLALELVERFGVVVDDARDRHRVVLLDEYQDTSVVQTRLLAGLFAGAPVMAVGDPHQSIYGWRGASAANLDEFAAVFGAELSFSLSTSWRNGHDVLRVANAIAAPLSAHARVSVSELKAGPAATDVPVEARMLESVLDEAAEVAGWFRAKLADSPGASAALLMRARRSLPFFLDALRSAGVPFHVLGVGGLLDEPEIADLVCALRVVDDPTAGSELVRLLAGPHWLVGPRDLHALASIASWLTTRDHDRAALDEDVRARLRGALSSEDGGSVVDALDFIAHSPGHPILERLTDEGRARLRAAGEFFAKLRSRTGLPLVDFVRFAMTELDLDLEVAANDSRTAGPANLEALFDALESYLAIDDVASLGGFLHWLHETAKREDLSPRPEDPEPGCVQVLTIHGSKGLEWDHVAVPRLVRDELPARPVEGTTGWLGFGRLPYPLRGDRADLPELAWRSAPTRKELVDAVDEFKAAVGARHALEERRLAYVAVTRARHSLLLSGSFWGGQSKPRPPSVFLTELADQGLIAPVATESEHEVDPVGELLSRFSWPRDPLGERRERVERAARLVREAAPDTPTEWDDDIELLLAERDARAAARAAVPIPTRIAASRFKDFVNDPAGTAARIRRPMPERPYRATRLGTLFHAWVEQRYGGSGPVDLVDASSAEVDDGRSLDEGGPLDGGGGTDGGAALDGDGALDDDARTPEAAAELARLRERFERSAWALKRPVDVECEIHLPFDGRTVVCKIDAVYRDGDRFEIVDWKTGRAPRNADELAERRLQLALYRIAYAKWKGIDPELVDAAFYFVGDDLVVRPERLESENELIDRWRAALVSGGSTLSRGE